jgi:hypothetical protein
VKESDVLRCETYGNHREFSVSSTCLMLTLLLPFAFSISCRFYLHRPKAGLACLVALLTLMRRPCTLLLRPSVRCLPSVLGSVPRHSNTETHTAVTAAATSPLLLPQQLPLLLWPPTRPTTMLMVNLQQVLHVPMRGFALTVMLALLLFRRRHSVVTTAPYC